MRALREALLIMAGSAAFTAAAMWVYLVAGPWLRSHT